MLANGIDERSLALALSLSLSHPLSLLSHVRRFVEVMMFAINGFIRQLQGTNIFACCFACTWRALLQDAEAMQRGGPW